MSQWRHEKAKEKEEDRSRVNTRATVIKQNLIQSLRTDSKASCPCKRARANHTAKSASSIQFFYLLIQHGSTGRREAIGLI